MWCVQQLRSLSTQLNAALMQVSRCDMRVESMEARFGEVMPQMIHAMETVERHSIPLTRSPSLLTDVGDLAPDDSDDALGDGSAGADGKR
jgi:hypothetical protein